MSDNPIVSKLTLTQEQERDLAQRYRDGDIEAGGTLIQAQSRWIMKLLNRMHFHSWVEVDDVFAEIMPEVLSALKNYDPELGRVSTYLHKVVKRNAAKAAQKLSEMSYSNDNFDPEQVCEPEEVQSLARETLQAVRSIIEDAPKGSLTEECRLIADRLFKGRSQDEISRELGWPPMRVSEALVKIKGLIAKRAIDLSIDLSHWASDERLESMARKAESDVVMF